MDVGNYSRIPFGAFGIGFLLLSEKLLEVCPATVYHEDHCMTTQEVMFPKRRYQIFQFSKIEPFQFSVLVNWSPTRICKLRKRTKSTTGSSLLIIWFWPRVSIPYHPCMVYFPTFTIQINHPCRWIYRSSHGWYGNRKIRNWFIFPTKGP